MSDSRAKDREANQNRGTTTSNEQSESRWTWLIPLALIALLVGLYFAIPPYRDFADKAYSLLTGGNQEAFETWVRGFGVWGPMVILALMIMQTLLAFIPSVLIMVVTVVAYGPLWGGLLTWVGLMVAAAVGYGIGRAVGPATVYQLIGEKTESEVEGFVQDYGVWAIVAARVSPALSTDAVSFVAGLVKMGWLRFILATGAGILPLTVLIAFLGSDFQRLESGLIWVSVVSVVLFLGYVAFDKWRGDG